MRKDFVGAVGLNKIAASRRSIFVVSKSAWTPGEVPGLGGLFVSIILMR